VQRSETAHLPLPTEWDGVTALEAYLLVSRTHWAGTSSEHGKGLAKPSCNLGSDRLWGTQRACGFKSFPWARL